MKNKQKSRSGCRTCKLRRLRCDETKPACRNCTQKNFECPGYQQRLQWSTKYEKPVTNVCGPSNFSQLVSAASQSIAKQVEKKANDHVNGRASDVTSSTKSPAQTPTATTPKAPETVSPSESPKADHATPVASVDDSRSPSGEGSQEASSLTLSQHVVDIPSFLIEHWFKSVCGSWSAYDSQSNPYRRLTSNLWTTSKPVFYALQAISAASLVERLPHVMKDTAKAAPRLATEAIKKELAAFSTGSQRKFPSELLLSLFCMSSSLCWMESRELGLQYVRQARAVLKCLDGWMLDEEDQELLEFFNGCLIYEEMLRSVVSDNEVDFNNMLSWPEPSSQASLVAVSPHAWTGVSPDVLRLFGKAIALCQRSRSRWRHNDGTSYRLLQGAMQDIEEARMVEESLLATEVRLDASEALQIKDHARHLQDTTEAYRLSSLLQLYETFPDLTATRIPALTDAAPSVAWNAWVSPLALHITEILEGIPPESMRCIQPLVCLCAGSGLRYDSSVSLTRGPHGYLLLSAASSPGVSPPATPPPLPNDTHLPSLDPGISESSLKVSRARHFLMSRLDDLELSLPPKPIGVAKQLLRAMWNAYDEEIATPRRTHWLDVMSRTGLQSLFG
ncbi:fungal-specific transcription factor domain-containing protein [Diplogelasinospora grovesii]|uniref:Fungal-specific transcription factor domain-containing protein n=1 Tax=Diplogelasinospora grovesii TaxID=303347 RepID=A0AAN6N3N4_9PEZI|nr:fungal-specific transcription factor domain-containing protein [Diplogelasinospora grovesii]